MPAPTTSDRIFVSVVTNKPTRKPRQRLLDVPTFTIPEAAAFLAIPRRTMHSWFGGSERLFMPSGHVGEYALLSFNDVAEAYILYVLREFHQFAPTHLRRVLEELRKETKSKHPLLGPYLRVFGKTHLLLEKPRRGKREREIVDLSKSRNLAIGPVVDVFSKRILQDGKGQPLRLFPWRFFIDDNDSRPVTMDPDVMSGRLVVTGTRIPVSVLLGLKAVGKTPEEIAKNYRLSPDIVEKALLHIEPSPVPKVA